MNGSPGVLGRRAVLAGGAAAALGVLAGCGSRGDEGFLSAAGGVAAEDLGGSFSWRRNAGDTVRVLLTAHHYTDALVADLDAFQEQSGVRVSVEILPEAVYFDRVTTDLLQGSSGADVFMLGAYMVWQYGPPGWLEDLRAWIASSSATAPDYDVEDFYPNLLAAGRWDFTSGSPVGSGGQWAMPWGWEANVVAYQADLFARLGLKPAGTLDELVELAAAAQAGLRRGGRADGYGLAVRGTRSWATIHPGFMTQYTREGCHDFTADGSRLVPAMATPSSVSFHRRWMSMVRASGPADWTSYTYQDCVSDLGSRRAAMVYDATSVTSAVDKPGASAAAGSLAWHPGPAGPGGSLDTNLWVWMLAMNSRSTVKPAAWLLLQWATGRAHLREAALHHDHNDPVRQTVATDRAYLRAMAGHRGYSETVEAVRPHTAVQFTPQRHFFDAATTWAGALQDIHAGADAQTRLDALATQLGGRV